VQGKESSSNCKSIYKWVSNSFADKQL